MWKRTMMMRMMGPRMMAVAVGYLISQPSIRTDIIE